MNDVQDFKAMFASLPLKLGLKLLRRAARKAGAILRDEAARRAPRDSGDLAAGMTMRTRKEDATSISLEVGPSKKQFYGHMVEGGTKHTRPQPFLGPAMDAKGEEAAGVFMEILREEIDAAWRKGV